MDFPLSGKIELRGYYDHNLDKTWTNFATCDEFEASLTLMDLQHCCDFIFIDDVKIEPILFDEYPYQVIIMKF